MNKGQKCQIFDFGSGRAIWPFVMNNYWQGKGYSVKFYCIDAIPRNDNFMPIICGRINKLRSIPIFNPENALLMLHWPYSRSSTAYNVLAAFKGYWLLYAGEERYGRTAHNDFFDLLTEEWQLIDTYTQANTCINHSKIYIYHKKYRQNNKNTVYIKIIFVCSFFCSFFCSFLYFLMKYL